MAFSWADMPATFRAHMLRSGVGMRHLLETAHTVFQGLPYAAPHNQAELYATACDVLLAAWESMFLEPSTAVTLNSLPEAHSVLPPKIAACIKRCARQPQPDQELIRHLNPARAADALEYEETLRQARDRNDNPFFVIRQAVIHAFTENRPAWLRDFIRADTVLPPPLKDGLLADAAFASGDWRIAAVLYAKAMTELPLLTWATRRAEALYRNGQRDEAVHTWRSVHAARPWQINTLLRLSDVLMGRDADGPFPNGQGVVLLYTWNKAQDIDSTLASLAASELSAPQGEARIIVLDNGSTDATPDVLRKWKAHFAGRLSTVILPVNVGAPAARNWLLSMPETRKADWAAFLDDDVAIPADWLRHLWAALCAYPEAGVASGHAVDFHAPMNQQWTDMHIIPLTTDTANNEAVFRDRFKFSAPHEQSYDFGEFSFIRPCVTAIGCCHMFTRDALDHGGTFDIRFSPSQSDDVDHDMRRGLSGRLPVYNGHLRVLHKRSTGYHKTPNRRGWASAVGNWYKLQASYSEKEVEQIHTLDQNLMWDDLQQRLAVLNSILYT